jgi:hypothetical protein
MLQSASYYRFSGPYIKPAKMHEFKAKIVICAMNPNVLCLVNKWQLSNKNTQTLETVLNHVLDGYQKANRRQGFQDGLIKISSAYSHPMNP